MTMALITAPMNTAMKARAMLALIDAGLPEDTMMSPRQFRHLVLQHIPDYVDETRYREVLTAEGWFTSDRRYGDDTSGKEMFVRAADTKVRVI